MFQMMQQHCGKFICTTLYFNRASKEQRKHVQIYHVLWDGNVFPLHVFKEDSSLGASLSLAPVSLSWQRMGELSLGAAAHGTLCPTLIYLKKNIQKSMNIFV